MGNRFPGAIEPGAMPPLHSYLGNPVLSTIGRIFFRIPVRDFHCGLRAFRRDAILALNLRTTGMEFASEMVVKSSLAGLRMTEVPTTLSPDGRSRPPHLRSWRDGWRHLRFLLLFSPRWLFFYPGVITFFVGLIISLWLLPGPQTLGRWTFDVDTLTYSLGLVLIGAHISVFAVSARVFGTQEGFLPPNPKFERIFNYINLEVGLIFGWHASTDWPRHPRLRDPHLARRRLRRPLPPAHAPPHAAIRHLLHARRRSHLRQLLPQSSWNEPPLNSADSFLSNCAV